MSQTKRPSARLGEQIERLIYALALAKCWRIGQAVSEVAWRTGYSESAVYRWRQGRLRPPDKTLEVLARIGKEEAGLARIWGESLFRSAGYSDVDYQVNVIWGPKEIRPIPNNLPSPAHTDFVGRRTEMTRLLKLLSPQHAAHLISVDGIGGVGKTALVLEAAFRCLRASTGEVPNPRVPTFEAIVFTSAKQQYLTSYGILTRHQAQHTLRDIFREIARTLDRQEITRSTPDNQRSLVYRVLARQRTLLIVDNLETAEDRQDILEFLYDLPSRVKAVITTRERALFSPIRLEQLPKAESLELIQHEARRDNLVPLDDEQVLALYQRTGGVPAAMVYAVGQLACGHSMETVLERVAQATSDVAHFCFEGSVAPLRGQPAHHLLMALALFPKRPLREAVIHVAGLNTDPIAANDGLAHLQCLSLVSKHEGRYNMLPLTREYALAELVAHPDFEREARERWVGWYLDFAKKHGGEDWREWHILHDRLEEEWDNYLAVFNWCAAQERYTDIRAFWLEDRVNQFANLYGHWDDRLTWLGWLIEAAERRGEWSTAVEAMTDKGWTLTMMGQPEQLKEADALMARAWNLSKVANSRVRRELAQRIATLRVRQKKYPEAYDWYNRVETILNKLQLKRPKLIRLRISIPYWQAVICYENKDYDEAETLFRQVLEHGQAIGWQRAVIYAQNWLADIAIARGNLDEAERLLQTGLPVAERNKDKRRTAFYRRSFAHLEQKRGSLDEARRWAEESRDGFERLGMHPEAEEMHRLLAELGH